MAMTTDQLRVLAVAQARARAAAASASSADSHPSFEEGEKLLDAQDQQQSVQGASGTAGAGLTGFVNGLPVVGPAALGGVQRAAAGISSVIDGDSYDNKLKAAQDLTQQVQTAHPNVTTGGQIAGGIVGTAPIIAAAPAAFGIGDGALLGRTLASMGSSGTLSAADSAARSDGDLGQTGKGLAIGLGAGAVSPILGKAIGAGARYLIGGSDDALSSLSKGAQKYATDQLSDPAKIASQQSALQALGPEATLADVSPEWLGVARGAATRPGTRDAIITPLNERSALANTRLRTDLDQSLGSPIIPSQVDAGLRQSQNTVAQGYGPIMGNARGVDTQALADNLDAQVANLRGPAQRAVQQVRGYLNIPGATVNGQAVLDPNPQALMASRHAIDGLLETEVNPDVVRVLTGARNDVDGLLAQAAPGVKDVDAQFSELARQREALTQGRPILSNEAQALRPQEVDDMMQQGALPQGTQIGPSGVPFRMKQAVRAEIDRATGTKAIDTTAVRNIVRGEGDWNRTKLGTIFGQDNADQALNAIDRETTFGDTANRITRGSDTAMANGFGQFLNETAKSGDVPTDTTLTGIGIKSGKKLLQALMQQNADGKAAKFAEELGHVSVARGTQRDQLVNALMARAQAGNSSVDPKMQALISAIMQTGGRQALR